MGRKWGIFMGLFKRIFLALSSVKFGAFLLGLIIFISILGTVILQDVPEEMYIEAYGRIGYRFFSALGLFKVFRSLWLRGLLFLLGLSLLSCILRQLPFRPKKIGFFLIHSSIIVILVGALISSIWGDKGEMLLRIGLLMLLGGFIFSFFIKPLLFKGKAK